MVPVWKLCKCNNFLSLSGKFIMYNFLNIHEPQIPIFKLELSSIFRISSFGELVSMRRNRLSYQNFNKPRWEIELMDFFTSNLKFKVEEHLAKFS